MNAFLDLRKTVRCILLLICFLVVFFIACPEPGDPVPEIAPEPVNNIADYPYVVNDSTYDSVVKVYNKSEYLMELDVIYRNPNGVNVGTTSTTLNPHQSREFSSLFIVPNISNKLYKSKYTDKCSQSRINGAKLVVEFVGLFIYYEDLKDGTT